MNETSAQQATIQYTIEGKVVEKSEFHKFLKMLKPDEKTWYCAETTFGGKTGYRAKNKSGKVYKVETVVNTKAKNTTHHITTVPIILP